MSFMRLASGDRHFFGEPFIPNIEDIAFALSNINRYGGHVGQYSVAQHCVLVAMHLPDHLKLSGLLPEYKALEQHYHGVIDSYFDVWTRHEKVKEVDLRMLVTEAQHFGIWERGICWPAAEPFHIPDFQPMGAKFAERAFLSMFEELT